MPHFCFLQGSFQGLEAHTIELIIFVGEKWVKGLAIYFGWCVEVITHQNHLSDARILGDYEDNNHWMVFQFEWERGSFTICNLLLIRYSLRIISRIFLKTECLIMFNRWPFLPCQWHVSQGRQDWGCSWCGWVLPLQTGGQKSTSQCGQKFCPKMEEEIIGFRDDWDLIQLVKWLVEVLVGAWLSPNFSENMLVQFPVSYPKWATCAIAWAQKEILEP